MPTLVISGELDIDATAWPRTTSSPACARCGPWCGRRRPRAVDGASGRLRRAGAGLGGPRRRVMHPARPEAGRWRDVHVPLPGPPRRRLDGRGPAHGQRRHLRNGSTLGGTLTRTRSCTRAATGAPPADARPGDPPARHGRGRALPRDGHRHRSEPHDHRRGDDRAVDVVRRRRRLARREDPTTGTPPTATATSGTSARQRRR